MMQYGYPYYQQMYQQQLPQMQAPQQQVQQIRNGGIVSVASEEVARNYPVAPGMTVTMRDESAPYLYEKTMGFSQLDQPIFRKARIIFEDAAPAAPDNQKVYAELSQLEALRDAVSSDIRDIRSIVAALANDKRRNMNDESTTAPNLHAIHSESGRILPTARNADAATERTEIAGQPHAVHA